MTDHPDSHAIKIWKLALFAAVTAFALPALHSTKAYADPPPWAKAYGHEDRHGDKHRHKHDRDREDDDEDDDNDDHDKKRQRRVVVIPAPAVYVAPYGIAQGTCNRKLLGQVLGGATGAAIGSQIGGGRGKTVAMVGGGILGVIVGGNIGQSMDRVDQGCVGQILEHAPDGRRVAWTDPKNGGLYQVVPAAPYQTHDGLYCRPYSTNAVMDGYNRQISGTACRQPNGIWQMVN
jgi:surface antigen